MTQIRQRFLRDLLEGILPRHCSIALSQALWEGSAHLRQSGGYTYDDDPDNEPPLFEE